ncbi:DUF7620 family protein [Streptomyces sp.]|uniref:DUF7620 family protein n=1 Tax=Streptomyces sp. TaxID=1931 RepID=UPI002F95ED19
MTERDDGRLPDIDEARQAAEESQRRAEEDMQRARERARKSLSLADRLRRLREQNGFDRLFDDAFGGVG